MSFNKIATISSTFVLLFLFIGVTSIYSQTYHFDNYSVKEGLAQSSIHTIVQDEEGYLWMGTASGVSKFDGQNFVNYTAEDGLAEGTVKSIMIDSVGNIWFGHVDGGVSRLVDGKMELLFSINADVTSIMEDGNGNVWIGSFGEGAMKVMNPYSVKDSLTFKQYKGQEGLSDIVVQISLLNQSELHFITNVGVKQYLNHKDEFVNFKVKDMPAYFQFICMYESKNGDQWFGTYNDGLYCYRKSSGKLEFYNTRDGLAHNWIS